MAGTIGERSDAVLRTAIGERSDAVLRTAIGEPSGLAFGKPKGQLRDAVLRTAMPGHDCSSEEIAVRRAARRRLNLLRLHLRLLHGRRRLGRLLRGLRRLRGLVETLDLGLGAQLVDEVELRLARDEALELG